MADESQNPQPGSDAPNVEDFKTGPDTGTAPEAQAPPTAAADDDFDPIAELQMHGEGAKVVLDFIRETAKILKLNPHLRVRAVVGGVTFKDGPNSSDVTAMAFLHGSEVHVEYAAQEIQMRILGTKMQRRGIMPGGFGGPGVQVIKMDSAELPPEIRALLAARLGGTDGAAPQGGEGPQG